MMFDRITRPGSRTLCGAMFVGFALGPSAHAQVPTDPYSHSRTSSFGYQANGLLSSETIEPDNAQLCVTTSYTYDPYGNKADVGASKAATTANCGGASGLALITSRSSSSAYAAQTGRIGNVTGATVPVPAGAFATSAANALNQGESRIYDPRFGVPVSLLGPNALTTSWTLDDFGRKTLETRADGTKTAMYYCWITAASPHWNRAATSTSSNTPGCPTPSAAEIPADAARFEHVVPLNASDAAIGAFTRVYYGRSGIKIRTVTQAFDGASQPGGTTRLIVADTDYNQYGMAIVVTQPYFLDSTSSNTSGSANVGMTLTEYDALGRASASYTADPTVSGQQTGGSEASVTFGGRGSRQATKTTVAYSGLVTVTTVHKFATNVDDQKRTRKEEKNLDGKLVRVTDSSGTTVDTGAQIVHQHDAFGNLVTTKDALNNRIVIAYDIRGRKISLNDPDAGVTAYCYDALGQLKAQQSSNQRGSHTVQACPTYSGASSTVPATPAPSEAWTHLAYDVLGRMAQRVEPEYTSNWTYDSCTKGVGKLCQTSTSNGVTKKMVYDSLGRPINTRTDITSGPSTTSAVAYDPATGRVASQTYPTGVQLSYQYTANGYLQAVKLGTAVNITPLSGSSCSPAASCALAAGATLWSAAAVNAWGRAEQHSYGNGINNRAVYEPQSGRLTSLTAGPGATDSVVKQRYAWDNVNLLTSRVDAIGDVTGVEVRDDFTYDKLGRLTQYAVNGGTGTTLYSRTVELAYNALGMLLSKSDVGNLSYPAQGVANGRPHAVQTVSGLATSYSYDLNGNAGTATAGKWRTITYTSFNLPGNVPGNQGIDGPGATPRSIWQYDEGHQRIKEVRTNASGARTTWYLHPDNQGGLGFEREIAPNGTQSNRHYVSAGGSAFAVLVTTGALPPLTDAQTAPTTLTTVTAVKLEYWHKDQLGSLIATTDHAATVTDRYAYDPFGKRRKTDSRYGDFGELIVDWTTDTNKGGDRGFTGHEHLDDLGLVHMNGRIFDPLIGRFLQTDPFIQSPENLQNYDRFAYCFNSPTVCTDPSGQLSAYLKNPIRALRYIDPLNNYLLTKTAQNKYGYMIGSVAIGIGSFYCGPWYAACAAGGTAAWATFAGASDSQAFKSGLIAGVTAVAMNAVGSATTTNGVVTNVPGNIAGHALVGCASSAAGGGSCRSGALSGAFGAALSNSELYNSGSGLSDRVIATIQHSVAGGIGSVLGGGKFENGAITGAFGYLFNAAAHDILANKAAGIKFETAVVQDIIDAGYQVARNVELKFMTAGGELTTAVADYMYLRDGEIVLGEVKWGMEAKLSPGQKTVYDAIVSGKSFAIESGALARAGISPEVYIAAAKRFEMVVSEIGGRAARQFLVRWGVNILRFVTLPIQVGIELTIYTPEAK
jgi:RHS repeat-associated protein